MKHTQTTMFLLPALKLKGNIDNLIKDGFINSYLGWRKHLDTDEYGDYLYLTFDKEKISDVRFRELDNHPNLVDTIYLSEIIVFIFSMGEDFRETVVRPFLAGKYSQIDREFVKTYHPVFTQEDQFSYSKNPARMALDKSPELKQYWEDELKVIVEDGAELWSIPDKSQEILDYFSNYEDEL